MTNFPKENGVSLSLRLEVQLRAWGLTQTFLAYHMGLHRGKMPVG